MKASLPQFDLADGPNKLQRMNITAFTHQNSPIQPADFPRRVLLAVSGLTPQIVTETIYALAVNKLAPFVPTEVHLITSAEGGRVC